MNLAVLKLCEVIARALFTVGVTFLLPISDGGRFGLAATLAGLFAFGFGWERHIDLQRRLAGREAGAIDHAVAQLPRLWAINYAAMAPVLFLLGLAFVRLDPWLSAMLVIIAIGEQLANAAYNFTVLEIRYRPLVAIATARSFLVLAGTGASWLTGAFSLTTVMIVWAATSFVSGLAMLALWRQLLTTGDPSPEPTEAAFASGVFAQHRDSLVHFAIGGVAVLSIQIDRLVVSALLPLEQVGIYFRQVLIVSFAYQLFNVVSYNRRAADILAAMRAGDVQGARAVIARETGLIVIGVSLGCGALFATAQNPSGEAIFDRLHLDVMSLTVLAVGALTRIVADFQALLLNARFRENRLLLNQLLALSCGAAGMILLGLRLGVLGVASGALCASLAYAMLNLRSNSDLRKPTAP